MRNAPRYFQFKQSSQVLIYRSVSGWFADSGVRPAPERPDNIHAFSPYRHKDEPNNCRLRIFLQLPGRLRLAHRARRPLLFTMRFARKKRFPKAFLPTFLSIF